MRTCIKSRTSSNFDQIGQLTTELAVLECLKISHRLIMGNGVCMLAHSFLIKSSSKLLVTRTDIKARMSLISGLWFPWPIYMFLKWDLTLAHWTQVSDRCPFGLLVNRHIMESPRSVGQSWWNFICIISGMGERLLLGFGEDSIKTMVALTIESSHWLIMGKRSGERSLPFGLLV